jgi:hypothetical protein
MVGWQRRVATRRSSTTTPLTAARECAAFLGSPHQHFPLPSWWCCEVQSLSLHMCAALWCPWLQCCTRPPARQHLALLSQSAQAT